MPDVGTIIAVALVALAVVIAVVRIRKRAKGKSTGCSCGCSACEDSLQLLRDGDKPLREDGLPPCCRGQAVEPSAEK